MSRQPLKLLGRYDAGMLHHAFRVVLARAHLRQLRHLRLNSSVPIGCDIRPDGKAVAL